MNRKPWSRYFRSDIFFFILLLLQSLFLEYNRTITTEPQGRHKWRQSDCASFAWNYAETSANLFTPHFNNLLWEGDGKVAVEFPIVYWVVGMLYRVFGVHPVIFRLINLLLGFWGLWALFRIFKSSLKDNFYPVVLTLLFFTSPVLVFYLQNFLPDVPSLALALVGWYQVYRHAQEKNHRAWTWAMILFTLSTLIKASAGINLVMLIALVLIEKADWVQWKQVGNAFWAENKNYLVSLLGSFVVIISWYNYASWYSTGWDRDHFSPLIRPMYEIFPQDFLNILGIFFTNHLRVLFPSPLLLMMLVLLGMCFSGFGRRYRLFFTLSLLSLLGSIAYVFIFYELFVVHDYYLIVTFIFPAAILLQSSFMIKDRFPKIFDSWLLKLGLIGLLLFSAYQSRHWLRHDYFAGGPSRYEKQVFYQAGLQDFLDSVGVEKAQRVISIPDISPNNTLYLMRRRGWSLAGNPAEMVPPMTRMIYEQGASFLVISEESLLENKDLAPFLENELGQYNGVWVFDLRHLQPQ